MLHVHPYTHIYTYRNSQWNTPDSVSLTRQLVCVVDVKSKQHGKPI